jgi:hypothetical protein
MGRSEVTRLGAVGPEEEPGLDAGAPQTGADDEGGAGRVHDAIARRTGILVLVAVVAAAAAVLWTMRHLGTSGGLDLVDIDIDYPLDAGAGVDHEKGRMIIEELRTVGEFAQVPPHHVQMNPFTWKQDESRVAQEGPDAEELARQRRMEEIRVALASLHVQSVMGGRRPIAKISGELVSAGDTVGEFFTVRDIAGRSVTLATAEGDTYVLEAGGE